MPRQRKPKKEKEKFVKVQLPERIAMEAEKLLQSRGSCLANFLILQIMTFHRMNTIMRLEDQINFGKYIGAKVETVIRADPQYMIWVITQSNCRTRFHMEVIDLVTQMAAEIVADPRDIPFRKDNEF